ncbi:MAG: pyridoxal phosphate-dependent aminotransferase [Desulfohalobiaceae bacterium]|nr:pyridoxal phosphate-dependent aminotransferase [Desulfohalobiaceae bacterium]
MQYSDRIQSVKPSATLTINARAGELKAQGQDVISLAAGEPDFPPPPRILEAAKQAIDSGFNTYTPVAGIPGLLEAIADYFYTFYNVSATKEMVVATNGGKQGLYNLFQILLNPGDEVLIPGPYWVSYPDMVSLAGGSPVIVPAAPDNGFLLETEDLEAALTPKSKVLILNSPSNPTGSHYTQARLDAILEWAFSRELFVISDEIYDQLIYPPARPASASPWLEKSQGRIAVVNGLSKSFALTGWRIGYVLSHPGLIKNMIKIQGQSTSNICSIAQKAALAALTGSFDFLEDARRDLAGRRDKVLEIMGTWPGTICPKPDGAFYLFPRMDGLYSQAIPDSTALCTYLLENCGVALVPGVAFGDDRCLRFSYALEEETLLRGVDKVGEALQKI